MKTAEQAESSHQPPALLGSGDDSQLCGWQLAVSPPPLQILIKCPNIRQLKRDCHEHNSTFYILQVKSLQNNIDRADILEHSKA